MHQHKGRAKGKEKVIMTHNVVPPPQLNSPSCETSMGAEQISRSSFDPGEIVEPGLTSTNTTPIPSLVTSCIEDIAPPRRIHYPFRIWEDKRTTAGELVEILEEVLAILDDDSYFDSTHTERSGNGLVHGGRMQ